MYEIKQGSNKISSSVIAKRCSSCKNYTPHWYNEALGSCALRYPDGLVWSHNVCDGFAITKRPLSEKVEIVS